MKPLTRVTQAAARAASALEARNAVIREAAASETTRAIAKAAGLSHQRIHQIIHGR